MRSCEIGQLAEDHVVKIVIAGASGLVGKALSKSLKGQGHNVVRLVRGKSTGAREGGGGGEGDGEIHWSPETGELDAGRLEGVDAVVNLSGENVGAGRWTAKRREAILRSRVDATRTLVGAIQRMKRKPGVFVSASAVGFYGDRGDEELSEASVIGQGFLPEVCLVWETHAEGAARVGVRTVLMRFGVVLSAEGGALAKMLPVFRLGLGGKLGDGKQWMSWVSMEDVVGALEHAVKDTRVAGAVNVVAPAAVTNAEFTRTLGQVLRRPAGLAVPAGLLRLVLGEMADAALLASAKAVPMRLVETGYRFKHAKLEAALRAALGR